MKFEELIVKLNPKLKAITHKLNNRYTYFDEQDLYQEASTHLWEQNMTGFWNNKTDSYILQNCYYFLKNYIRKTYRSLDKVSLSLDAESEHTGHDSLNKKIPDRNDGFPVHWIDAHLLLGEITPVLTVRERNIFMMQLDGFTTREIGETLGISHVMVVKTGKKIKHKYAYIAHELLLS
ncbi:MAG: sigma-70 family RNA polymerase sigma factor [Candidatus Omnitrophica bacterium]|nr:sigma-70 family RNA polymerase sigma factor [Candidatus Omnitrophota bacterium]